MEHSPLPAAKGRRGRIFLVTALGIAAVLCLLHRPILRGMGRLLIVQDPLERCEALFVLSGNAFDRGREAARLHAEGWAPKVVCLGGEKNPALELYGIADLSWQSTRRVLLEEGVPAAAIDSLPLGTSTFEEFEAIADYCHARGLRRVMVVSSLFHTRRIDEFFRIRLKLDGVDMVLRGADESGFDEDRWWEEEAGLLFLNSEYIKLGYYWLRF